MNWNFYLYLKLTWTRHKRAMMFESQKGISLYVVTRHGADSVPGNISRNLETNLSH